MNLGTIVLGTLVLGTLVLGITKVNTWNVDAWIVMCHYCTSIISDILFQFFFIQCHNLYIIL